MASLQYQVLWDEGVSAVTVGVSGCVGLIRELQQEVEEPVSLQRGAGWGGRATAEGAHSKTRNHSSGQKPTPDAVDSGGRG